MRMNPHCVLILGRKIFVSFPQIPGRCS